MEVSGSGMTRLPIMPHPLGGEVAGWFRMPLLYADYANGQSGLCNACYPMNSDAMVEHAFNAARSAGVDFRAYDNDGPDGVPGSGDDVGIIDGFAVVFAGSGAERTGSPDDIRSLARRCSMPRRPGSDLMRVVSGERERGVAVRSDTPGRSRSLRPERARERTRLLLHHGLRVLVQQRAGAGGAGPLLPHLVGGARAGDDRCRRARPGPSPRRHGAPCAPAVGIGSRGRVFPPRIPAGGG
jgi:hypothetical protein